MKKSPHNLIFLLLAFLFSTGLSLVGQPLSRKQLAQALVTLQRELRPDKRVAILELELRDTLQTPPVIYGETDQPEIKERLSKLLSDMDVAHVDSIRVLPDSSLGNRIWALATLSVTNMRSQPAHASELLSQALMGTPLRVLEAKEGWYRVQTPDRFIGWMDSCALQRLSPEGLEQWKKSNRYELQSMSGYAYDRPSSQGNIVTDLVLGDIFVVEAQVKSFLKIKLPDGRIGYVEKEACLSWGNWIGRKPELQSIITVAQKMMGSPYLWGGTSSKAVDCSGLVKIAYYSQGIILSRDASQQVMNGHHPNSANIKELQPGDLLFFGPSADHITHVGIYMGNGEYIHASGMVKVNSIDPLDPKYNVTQRKNLVAASRILNSLNSEGITKVVDHPWYNLQP